MPYNIELPDGTVIQDMPDDMPRSEVRERILSKYPELRTEQDVGLREDELMPTPSDASPVETLSVDEVEGMDESGALGAEPPIESVAPPKSKPEPEPAPPPPEPEPEPEPEEQSVLRSVADVPLKLGQGAVTGIKFIMSSGNISAGTFKMYGIK